MQSDRIINWYRIKTTFNTMWWELRTKISKWWFLLNFELVDSQEDQYGWVTQVWRHKIFKWWKIKNIFLAPPRHVNCRCAVVNLDELK